MSKQYLFLFFNIVILTNIFSSDYRGYYLDYQNVKHEGTFHIKDGGINVSRINQHRIRFKDDQGKKKILTAKEVSYIEAGGYQIVGVKYRGFEDKDAYKFFMKTFINEGTLKVYSWTYENFTGLYILDPKGELTTLNTFTWISKLRKKFSYCADEILEGLDTSIYSYHSTTFSAVKKFNKSECAD